jgi:hypothetical protein
MLRIRRAFPPDSVTTPAPSSTVSLLATNVLVTTIVVGTAPTLKRIVPRALSAFWISAC